MTRSVSREKIVQSSPIIYNNHVCDNIEGPGLQNWSS